MSKFENRDLSHLTPIQVCHYWINEYTNRAAYYAEQVRKAPPAKRGPFASHRNKNAAHAKRWRENLRGLEAAEVGDERSDGDNESK